MCIQRKGKAGVCVLLSLSSVFIPALQWLIHNLRPLRSIPRTWERGFGTRWDLQGGDEKENYRKEERARGENLRGQEM
ncbi:hypothetical protein XENTR_v10012864 [Xenopus tropicalis]|nr:hypothetical protein XENTR_v10012864 [Xenopus tropicalis]